MQSPPYLWSWNTSFHWNSTHTCVGASLNNIEWIAFPVVLLLLMFRSCSQEGTNPYIKFLCILISLWNYNLGKIASIPLQQPYNFHYRMHIRIFFMCKCGRYFINTFVQHKTTAPFEDNRQNKYIIVMLVFNSVMVMNWIIVCRTFLVSNDL